MHRPLTRSRLLTGLVPLLTAAALLTFSAPQGAATVVKPPCPPGGVQVLAGASPATVTVTDTTTNTGVQVVVTITGTTFTIEPADAGITVETASWCLKARNAYRVETGTGTAGAATITNQNGVVKRIASVTVYSVTSSTDPVGACWDQVDAIRDFKYTGPINTVGNGFLTDSFDGSCTGGQFANLRDVVQAADQSGAEAVCDSLTSGIHEALNLRAHGWLSAPADFWLCLNP